MKTLLDLLSTAQKGMLIAVCARPGDGRRSFSIRLANTLAAQGNAVTYYSYSKSPTNLESTLSLPTDAKPPTRGIWILDDLTAGATALTLADANCTKIAILSGLRQIASERGLKIVVTDTHPRYTSRRLPIPEKGLALCDAVYEIQKRKDDI